MTAAARATRDLLVLACLFLATGPGCRREETVATALAVQGAVEASHVGVFRPVIVGTPFVVGDTLRTAAASQARLGLTGGGVIRVGERARLRFQRGAVVGQRAPDIAVELGSAEVEETTSDLSIVTAAGLARVARGTHLRVRTDGATASLEVVVGRAVMMDGGHEIAIESGRGVRIKIGSAEVQRFALQVGEAVLEEPDARTESAAAAGLAVGEPPPAAGPEAAPAPALGGDGGTSTAAARGGRDAGRSDGGRADITLAAGESATVHDGRPRATVRLRVDGICPTDATVELGGGHRGERATGLGSVVVRLAPGTRSYRVRCANDTSKEAPRASGTLTFRRDTGYVPLARRAPVNVIDADGRKYTVLFQTRLPQLTLGWSGAPAGAGALELHVESSAGERMVAASPGRPLPTGTVQEGTYALWYRAPDGKQSPRTTLSVRFDNAAPTAQFLRTAAAATSAPGVVAVDGVTVEGAKVSVGGEPLAVDAHGRFRAEAKPLEGDDAVAVRLEHPRTGVHYYVRHRAEAR